jgi:hypothetical protein
MHKNHNIITNQSLTDLRNEQIYINVYSSQIYNHHFVVIRVRQQAGTSRKTESSALIA